MLIETEKISFSISDKLEITNLKYYESLLISRLTLTDVFKADVAKLLHRHNKEMLEKDFGLINRTEFKSEWKQKGKKIEGLFYGQDSLTGIRFNYMITVTSSKIIIVLRSHSFNKKY